MSETATTVIKLIASLASPKASIKYFFVALGIIFSWEYAQPLIVRTGMSEEQAALVVLLLGVGIGTFLGHYIASFASFVWKIKQNKKELEKQKENLKKQKEKADAEKQDNIKKLVSKFETAFPHFTSYQKSVLRELTKKNGDYDLGWPDIKALHDSGYIEMLSHITKNQCLFMINPLLKDIVIDFYQGVVKNCTTEFLANMNEDFEEFLIALESDKKDSDKRISQDALGGIDNLFFSSCVSIQHEINGFWIYFNEDYREEFERQTGKSYLDEVFIKSKWIVSKGS